MIITHLLILALFVCSWSGLKKKKGWKRSLENKASLKHRRKFACLFPESSTISHRKTNPEILSPPACICVWRPHSGSDWNSGFQSFAPCQLRSAASTEEPNSALPMKWIWTNSTFTQYIKWHINIILKEGEMMANTVMEHFRETEFFSPIWYFIDWWKNLMVSLPNIMKSVLTSCHGPRL